MIQYCGFEAPPEERRYLTNLQRLYMDVSVLNITEAQHSIESENFIDSLEDLPAEVSISGIIPRRFHFILCFERRKIAIFILVFFKSCDSFGFKQNLIETPSKCWNECSK